MARRFLLAAESIARLLTDVATEPMADARTAAGRLRWRQTSCSLRNLLGPAGSDWQPARPRKPWAPPLSGIRRLGRVCSGCPHPRFVDTWMSYPLFSVVAVGRGGVVGFFEVSRGAQRRARIRAKLPTEHPPVLDQIDGLLDGLPDPQLLCAEERAGALAVLAAIGNRVDALIERGGRGRRRRWGFPGVGRSAPLARWWPPRPGPRWRPGRRSWPPPGSWRRSRSWPGRSRRGGCPASTWR